MGNAPSGAHTVDVKYREIRLTDRSLRQGWFREILTLTYLHTRGEIRHVPSPSSSQALHSLATTKTRRGAGVNSTNRNLRKLCGCL